MAKKSKKSKLTPVGVTEESEEEFAKRELTDILKHAFNPVNMPQPPTFDGEVAQAWIENALLFIEDETLNPDGDLPAVPVVDFLESFGIGGESIPADLRNYLEKARFEIEGFEDKVGLRAVKKGAYVQLDPIADAPAEVQTEEGVEGTEEGTEEGVAEGVNEVTVIEE